MRHACVPPRCGRMRVPEGLERGAGITRICSDADGSPEEATGATLWQRFPGMQADRSAMSPKCHNPLETVSHCHERSRLQERLFCSPGPGTQNGPPSTGTDSERDSRVTTGSSKVRPGSCGRSERTRPSRGRAPGSLAVGVTGSGRAAGSLRVRLTDSTPPAGALTPPNAGQWGGWSCRTRAPRALT